MRQNCKNTIISIIKKIKNLQQNKKHSQAMLIVDEYTSPLLTSVVYYFFALGVKNITKISLKKKPEPNCIGIYYLSSKSLKLINEDYKGQPIYHSINILLNEEVTPDIIKMIGAQTKIMQRLAFFGQLKLSTKYLDNDLGIICGEQQIFKSLMKNQQKKSIQYFANKMFESIVSGYGNNFYLKIYYQQNQHISDIIKILGMRYKEHMAYLTNAKGDQLDEKNQQKSINIMLVDRKIDLVSPIVRNFYYFTMISDLLKIDYEHKKANLRQEKAIQLSYDDVIFNQYKNLHISKAQTIIESNFKQFKTQNKAAQLNKQKNIEGVEIKHIIRDIPEFNKKVASYETQISLMYQIATLSKEQNISEIGEVEQMIATGINGHGEQWKDKKIYQRAMQVCIKIKNPYYLVKIWLLLLLCNELSQSDKKALIHKIKQVPAYQNLGLTLQSRLNMIMPRPMKLKPLFKKQKSFLDFHQCLIVSIINQITQNGTSKAVNFTIIGEQQKKNESKFEKMNKKQPKQWLACMFGGLSINQICQLQRLAMVDQNIRINMLTDTIFTTQGYIDHLGNVFV